MIRAYLDKGASYGRPPLYPPHVRQLQALSLLTAECSVSSLHHDQ